jgi:PAS domain S-box-containing protein
VHDQNFKITYCNKATEDLFGLKKEEIIGKDPDARFNTFASPDFIAERRKAIQQYGFWMGELKRKDAEGNVLDLHIALNSFKDLEGKQKGYFSITSDITKLVNAQNEVKKLADSLAEVNQGLQDQVASKTTLINDVFERVHEVFMGTDNAFKINYASKHIESIFGMSFERVIGMHIKDLLLELSGFDYSDAPQIAFDTNKNIRFEFNLKQAESWFEANIYPSKNGISIHFIDITEKLKSEAEALKSQKMYEFISKANEHILIAKNAEDLFQNICDIAVSFENILFCWIGAADPSTSKMVPVKFAGKEEGYLSAIKAISIKDQPEGNGPSGIAFRTGKYYYVNDIANDPEMIIWREEALKRGYRSDISIPIKVNGKVEYVFTIYTSKPYYFTEEQIALMVNISENISFALQAFYVADLKKASDTQLQKVLKAIEQSSASIVISDVEGNIEYVNPAFTKLTGYTFAESIGKNPRILKTGHTSDTEYLNLWDNLTHNKEWSGEFCNKKKNGELYWEYAVISPVLNEAGEISNYVAVKENITEQKKLQEDQRRLTADLIKRNHDLEKFSYVLSHNIRGPLSNILGLKDAILRGNADNVEQSLLQSISSSAVVMDQVIREVTQVINRSKLSLEEKTEINFENLLNSVKGNIEQFILEKQAVIETDFTKAPSCYSLETYISSIFYHLTVNALKFSKLGVPAKIQIWSELLNNRTIIHFKDYGIGIDLNRYGKIIFGLYKRFQLNIEGRGIGLYLVKSQVDFLGGDFEIKSELNEWTEFIISLPIEQSDTII